MKRGAVAGIVLASLTAGAWGGGPTYEIVDSREDKGASARRLGKILVVGISDDREVRNRFEDKFVTHLRGRGIEAMASHPLVPELTSPGDRDRILEALALEKVDAAMTVRAVPLDELGEPGWAAAWTSWVDAPSTVGDLIRKTVPVPEKRARRYGIEFALWDIATSRPVWAARTGAHTSKELRSGVSDLLQLAISALRDTPWLGPQ